MIRPACALSVVLSCIYFSFAVFPSVRYFPFFSACLEMSARDVLRGRVLSRACASACVSACVRACLRWYLSPYFVHRAVIVQRARAPIENLP